MASNNKDPIDINDAIESIKVKPVEVKRGCLFIILCGVLFMSGFFAVGTYVLSTYESTFFANGIQATATVQSIKQKQVKKEYSERNGKSSRNKKHTIEYISVVALTFEDQSGNQVKTRQKDGKTTLLEVGDTVEIIYDPEDPKDIRFFKRKKSIGIMKNLFNIFFSIFGFTGVLILFMLKK